MTKPKYEPGLPIMSWDRFMANFLEQRPIYFNHKVTTIGWYQNWDLHLIKIYINRGFLKEALPIYLREFHNNL